MELERELAYRTKLAVGYLDEARADLELSRWRSCVDNSQLSVENAALGPGVHVASDYGDEASWLTPWEIFGEEDARGALGLAEQATACLMLLLHPEPPDHF